MQNTPKSLIKRKIEQKDKSSTKLACIFLIARQNLLVELLNVELSHEGYEVKVFHDSMAAAIAIRQAESDLPDLIVLDWSISFLSGFDICYYLRSSNKYIPIVALTESAEVSKPYFL